MRSTNHNLKDTGFILGKPFREKTPATQILPLLLFHKLKFTKPLGLTSNHEEEFTQL